MLFFRIVIINYNPRIKLIKYIDRYNSFYNNYRRTALYSFKTLHFFIVFLSYRIAVSLAIELELKKKRLRRTYIYNIYAHQKT